MLCSGLRGVPVTICHAVTNLSPPWGAGGARLGLVAVPMEPPGLAEQHTGGDLAVVGARAPTDQPRPDPTRPHSTR